MPNKMNAPSITEGFHLVIDALKLNGLDTIFGVAGIPVTDLARLAQPEGIRYIGLRHEQSAGNAAAISGKTSADQLRYRSESGHGKWPYRQTEPAKRHRAAAVSERTPLRAWIEA